METSFLSFFVVKLKQIHIDKGITAGYSTNIPQCKLFKNFLDFPNVGVIWESCQGSRQQPEWSTVAVLLILSVGISPLDTHKPAVEISRHPNICILGNKSFLHSFYLGYELLIETKLT